MSFGNSVCRLVLRGSRLKHLQKCYLVTSSYRGWGLSQPSNTCARDVIQKLSPLRSFVRNFSDFPPHTIIKLPNLSPTMETGTVVSWAKNEGDLISEGDLLAEIETDKATMSLDASDEGYLAKILYPAGSKDILIGTALCVVVEDASMVDAFKSFSLDNVKSVSPPANASAPAPKEPTAAAAPPAPPSATAPSPIPAAPVQQQSGARVFASPLAKKLAAEQGIHLGSLVGSGMWGMIVSRDLKGAKPGMPAAAVMSSFSDTAITGMRSSIAKRLLESKRTIPHYYLTIDVNVDNVMKLRETINAKLAKSDKAKLSVNDLIIKAAAVACMRIPECNSSWQGDSIRQYNSADICVAVATPGGLITPIVAAANQKTLTEISATMVDLATRAKANKLAPQEFQGGTFTISNLGMFGISNFSAIINPPHACILAVGSTSKQVLPCSTDPRGYRTANVMSVTLCCDHRVVDGAVGAQWLSEFRSCMEEPGLMVL